MKFQSKCHYKKDNLGAVDTDGRIILKGILKKEDIQLWIEFIFLKTGPSCDFCKHGN